MIVVPTTRNKSPQVKMYISYPRVSSGQKQSIESKYLYDLTCIWNLKRINSLKGKELWCKSGGGDER